MKCIALLVVGALFAVSSVKAETFESGLFHYFTPKLSMDAKGNVYVDSKDAVKDYDGKIYPVKHILAIDTGDAGYQHLRKQAAQGLTAKIDGRFETLNQDQSKEYNGAAIVFLVARADGRR